MVDVGWDQLDKGKFYAYSAAGLLVARTVVYPMMLLKTRAQASPTSGFKPWAATRDIVQREGLRGLYRGASYLGFAGVWREPDKALAQLVPMTLGVLPTQGLYITAMEIVRAALLPHVDNRLVPLIAGGSASLCAATLGVPIDVVTQRVQISNGSARGVAVVRDIWKTSGVRGFYRGYVASIVVYAPTSACWWGVYGNARAALNRTPLRRWHVVRDAVSGALAGVCAASVTIPLDTVKTRVQTARDGGQSSARVALDLYRAEGLRGFYRGLLPRMLSMAPTSTILVMTYETVKRLAAK